jgi:dihydrofolate reductase
MEINLIMAHDSKSGIGKNGKLPWHNKEDMEFFTSTTKGNGKNAVVMGHSTWQSLPHPPLADRINIVLSNTKQEEKGCVVVRTPEDAVTWATESGVEQLWVIGGAQTFQAFKDQGIVQEMFITTIHGDFDCDVKYSPCMNDYAISAWHQIEGGMITKWELA